MTLSDLSPEAFRERGIRAVLFDKDGTLLDSLGPWAAAERALCRVLAARRLSEPTAIEAAVSRMLSAIGVGPGGSVEAEGLLAAGTTDRILAALRNALSEACRTEICAPDFSAECAGILSRVHPGGGPESRPMPGADGLVRDLRAAGFPLGLATADDHARACADLSRSLWLGLFDFLYCGDTAREPKPSPWSVFEFSRETGMPVAAIAVVGDTEADRSMAEKAGAGLFVRVG